MDPLLASLERSPELFPLGWDARSDAVTLIRLTRRDYDAASFLDERLLVPPAISRTLPWAQLSAAVDAGRFAERCNFIFHIGHVGSTLLSRLLGEDRRLFALREPAALRNFALVPEGRPWTDAELEARLAVFLKLWSRTFAPDETALIKATSFVSDLAPALMARYAGPKAALVIVKPATYLATILGGQNTRQEAVGLSAERRKRLERILGKATPTRSSEGENIALAWAVEMCGLVEAQRVAGARALAIDFDQFLAEPEPMLLATFLHFGSDATPERVSEILAGPLMQRYSKAPEHAYSPTLRREILDEARKIYGAEIDKGLAWLERAALAHPLIGECLAMTGG